jgi:hypothetical protein
MRLVLLVAALAAQPEVIDRTLALVGGQAITLSDVRGALALGLVEITQPADPIADVTAQLVDRELILREVRRYAPPAPGESAVAARLDEVRRRFADAAALARALEQHGFSTARLRAWVEDDLRAQAYLAQRFASASAPTDADVAAAYAQQKAMFDKAQLSADEAAPLIRERLVVTRRRELIADWVIDLRRRTEVVVVK